MHDSQSAEASTERAEEQNGETLRSVDSIDHGWTNEVTATRYWVDTVDRDIGRLRGYARSHRNRALLFALALLAMLAPLGLVLENWSLSLEAASTLFLAFFSLVFIYTGLEVLVGLLRSRSTIALPKLKEFTFEKHGIELHEIMKVAMYELALGGRIAALVLGYPALNLTSLSIETLAIISSIATMGAINVSLIHSHLTGERYMFKAAGDLAEGFGAVRSAQITAIVYLFLGGLSLVTAWHVGASFQAGSLALIILALFVLSRALLHEYAQFARHKVREREAKRFRRWVSAEKPSFDSSRSTYASLMAGGMDGRASKSDRDMTRK